MTATAIVEGTRVPWDEETFSDSDSEWSDDDDNSKTNRALQGSTELKQLHTRSRSIVTSLMRLTMAIREPAPSRQALRIDRSYHEPYDVQHVQAKFSNCAPYLAERLGRATSSRRQYFVYRETHCKKLSKGIETIGLEAPRTEHTDNSTEASGFGSQIPKPVDEDDETSSQTSYASSSKDTIRTPRLPQEASKGNPYECPLCFSLIAIYTTVAWKYVHLLDSSLSDLLRRHVYQDLHPYCCTFENCPTADRPYESRHAWFAHELKAHRTTFECVEGCDRNFTAESDQNLTAETMFHMHIQRSHPDLAVPAVYSVIRRTSARSPKLSDQATCKLCNDNMALRRLRKHLGQHQEQLALFALPATVEESTVDSDDSNQEGLQLRNDDQDESNDPEEIDDKAFEYRSYSDKDSSENKIARLERLILAQKAEQLKREAAAEAAAELKKRSDEDKLARLEKLILAQKDEQLKREAAAEAARKAAADAADAEAMKIAEEKKAAAEAAKLLLDAAATAREEANRRAAGEAEATRLMHEEALAEAKAETEELRKAKIAAEKAAAKLKFLDAPKAPIKFKDAVGRKFSFPWNLCKTWKVSNATRHS